MSLLEEAYKALEESEREFRRYMEIRERIVFRDACEKAWLASVLATDHLLTSYGYEKPGSGEERRRGLTMLEKKVPMARHLGIRDRFGSRAYHLQTIGFYEGGLDIEEFELEIEKVKEYLKISEELSKLAKINGN
jgi:hypothetical protein